MIPFRPAFLTSLVLGLLATGCRNSKIVDTGTPAVDDTGVASDGGVEDGGVEDGGVEDGGAEDGGAGDGGAGDGGAGDGGGIEEDVDGDGYLAVEVGGDDCDDLDPTIHPDAEEVCDGIDQDCDGEIDEGALLTFYGDDDGDGWGDSTDTVEACEAPDDTAAKGGDCDDLDAETWPGAPERCDEVDNDCDGEIDEEVQDTWYADSDGDGSGDADSTVEACDPDEGYVGNDDDCDDSSAAVNPYATELCDEVDNDCDGDIDEDDAADAESWYADSDEDGYGDYSTLSYACQQPEGTVGGAGDCDDSDGAVNPGADEICNELDDDCDDLVDDDDPDVTDATTWSIDYDGDGYGSDAYTVVACEQPDGWVDDASDCDDAEPASFPGNPEICDELDNDCDGDVDEDDASDAGTWYADSDGDGYGDPDSSTVSCEAPDGTVADDSDCDDGEDTVWPDADELYDALDNDCDGEIDEGLWIGTGADGALDVTGTTDLADDASGSREEADAAFYAVTAIDGDGLTLAEEAAGLAAGDEVLLINLQGSSDAHASVGSWELASVAEVDSDRVVLELDVVGTYGDVDNSDLADQTVILQRVPHYTDVTVAAGATLTTTAWEDGGTGLLAFRATGTVYVEDGGVITVASGGFGGGATGSCDNCDAFQGESYGGLGSGDEYGSPYNESIEGYLANLGGGGANVTGGGGSYGEAGQDGEAWYTDVYTAPAAGETYGDEDLALLFLGSGGGGVWNGGTDDAGEDPGPGGSGGGVLYIGADTISAEGAAALDAGGGDTSHWADGSWTYGAGGGSGGSLWLIADVLDLPTGAVLADGGDGMQTDVERLGGNGGAGRVRIDANIVGAYGGGSADAEALLEEICEPDPQSTGTAD